MPQFHFKFQVEEVSITGKIFTFTRPRKKFYERGLVRFVFSTTASFVVILLLLNLPAYFKIASFWVKDRLGSHPTLAYENNLIDLQNHLNKLPSLPEAGNANQLDLISLLPPDNRLIIPALKINVPLIDPPRTNLIKEDWGNLEKDIQASLQEGVIRYPGTALPGTGGNVFVTGHSSYYPWDPGRYKDIFAVLHHLNLGDRVMVIYGQKKYEYQVTAKKTVLPSEVEILTQNIANQLTLMTCTPVGTNLKRLIITAQEINSL